MTKSHEMIKIIIAISISICETILWIKYNCNDPVLRVKDVIFQ